MLIVCIGVEIYEKYLYIYSTIYYVSRKEFQCLFLYRKMAENL